MMNPYNPYPGYAPYPINNGFMHQPSTQQQQQQQQQQPGGVPVVSASEFLLNTPPSDGISGLAFSPSTDLLAVSSWDTTVRFYDVATNTNRWQLQHKAAVLDVCFSDDDVHCFSGGLDRFVRMLDVNAQRETMLGTHENAVRCLVWAPMTGQLISGSWDRTVKIWDPRASSSSSSSSPSSGSCIATIEQPDKVYSMSVTPSYYRLVVGTAKRHVTVYDLRKFTEPEQRRESALKYQTRCIRCLPDSTGYALSSVEGRVAMEYFDPDQQDKTYAFKCHRTLINGVDTLYPVNAIAFHPTYGTFATGGGDGVINVWDGRNKKRLCQYHKYPTSISALQFNHDGKYLAIAVSSMFETGGENQTQSTSDQVYIRTPSDSEVKPKAAL